MVTLADPSDVNFVGSSEAVISLFLFSIVELHEQIMHRTVNACKEHDGIYFLHANIKLTKLYF